MVWNVCQWSQQHTSKQREKHRTKTPCQFLTRKTEIGWEWNSLWCSASFPSLCNLWECKLWCKCKYYWIIYLPTSFFFLSRVMQHSQSRHLVNRRNTVATSTGLRPAFLQVLQMPRRKAPGGNFSVVFNQIIYHRVEWGASKSRIDAFCFFIVV